ncbi:acyltransferase [Mesorhizobium sp. 131-3-5]|nr:acyltransferase [Mesorhizobium sp. 131-3-5]
MKNSEIEMLRAVAVLLVILNHITILIPWEQDVWWPLFARARFWYGVDIFFVISGYVVTASLLREYSPEIRPAKFLASFAVRRAYRLLPLSWAVLAFVILLSAVWNSLGSFGTPYANLADAVSVLFYSANWHSYSCWKQTVKACGINNGLYWSLSLEEQFYILLPLAMVFARKHLVAICIVGILIQIPFDRVATQALWFTRTSGLLFGVLIALARANPDSYFFKPSLLRNDLIRIPLFAFMLTGLGMIAMGSIVTFPLFLLALGSAALVWVASFDEGLLFKKRHPLLIWIGSRSYAIYLLHTVSFLIVKELLARIAGAANIVTPTYSVIYLVASLGLTAALAELSARYFEKPLQRQGRLISQRIRNTPEGYRS